MAPFSVEVDDRTELPLLESVATDVKRLIENGDTVAPVLRLLEVEIIPKPVVAETGEAEETGLLLPLIWLLEVALEPELES